MTILRILQRCSRRCSLHCCTHAHSHTYTHIGRNSRILLSDQMKGKSPTDTTGRNALVAGCEWTKNSFPRKISAVMVTRCRHDSSGMNVKLCRGIVIVDATPSSGMVWQLEMGTCECVRAVHSSCCMSMGARVYRIGSPRSLTCTPSQMHNKEFCFIIN